MTDLHIYERLALFPSSLVGVEPQHKFLIRSLQLPGGRHSHIDVIEQNIVSVVFILIASGFTMLSS